MYRVSLFTGLAQVISLIGDILHSGVAVENPLHKTELFGYARTGNRILIIEIISKIRGKPEAHIYVTLMYSTVHIAEKSV